MDGDARVKARRPHHKSRNGCVQCKHRKVKCGEEKPKCKKCESYGTVCSFLQTHPFRAVLPSTQPAAAPMIAPAPILPQTRPLTIESMLSPEPSMVSSSSTHATSTSRADIPTPTRQPSPAPAMFTMQDLELFHAWTTTCAEGFFEDPTIVALYQTTLVQVAFEYPFLMHEILSLAALTLASYRPQNKSMYLHASDTHAATALSLFQPAISNLSEENCHACFAFSSLIWCHAWATQDITKPSTLFFSSQFEDGTNGNIIQWVKLRRGTRSILQRQHAILLQGPFGIIFNVWKDLDENRADPLPEDEERLFQSMTEAWMLSHSLSDEARGILDEAHKSLRRIFSMTAYIPQISNLAKAMSWLTTVSDEYVEMLERRVPEAILITMYYCVILKRLERMWWLRGKAENLLQTLLDVLGYNNGWERWTQWPVEQVFHGGGK